MKLFGYIVGWAITGIGLLLAIFGAWAGLAPPESIADAMKMQGGGYQLLVDSRASLAFASYLFLAPLTAAIVFNPLVFGRLPGRGPVLRALVATSLVAVALGSAFVLGPALYRLSPDARFREATAYFSGKERPKDEAKAFALAQQAAEGGNRDALLLQATMYRTGRGVARDLDQAAALLDKVAATRYLDDRRQRILRDEHFILGLAYRALPAGSPQRQKAVRQFELAANQGDTDAKFQLGMLYLELDAAAPDYASAMRWFMAAADEGDTKAMHNVGVMFQNGWGVPADQTIANTWFERERANGGQGS